MKSDEVKIEDTIEEVTEQPVESIYNADTAEEPEKVPARKRFLGLLAFIVLIAGAVTMIVNFGLGFSENSTNPENWIDLVPIILSAIISLFTYIVICVTAIGFIKGKGKGLKITYWSATVVAYAFILIPLIIDIVNVVKETQGN